MKNNFKLLFFAILIFAVLFSLFNVCAADCDNSTMELASSGSDLVLIENLDSDDAAMGNSNQDCDDDYLQIESYQSDSKEVNDVGSDVNDKVLKSDILKVSDSGSPNSANGAANIYVNYNSGNDGNSGSNWKNSVKTIEKALQLVDDDGVIHIANGITYLSDSTSNDGISIDKKVSIIGQSIDSIVSGNNNKRIFSIGLDGELFISNLTLTEGSASNGGAILILDNGDTTYGKLAMSNSIISNCYASSRGGAIYSDKGSVTNLNNVTFINDNSGSNGGAIGIQQRGSLSNVDDCKFINNSANNRGGAIYLGSNTACSIGSNNLFEGNKALGNYGFGGAIHGANGVSLGTGNVFVSNYAEKGGSALSTMNNKQITGSYAFFINNTAGGDSSVIYAPNAGVTTALNYCYWGTNNPAFSDYVVKGTFNHDNYLKLSVSADDSVISGNKLPITVDLSKNQNGQTVSLNSLPNMVPVLFTTTNGDFDVSSTKLVKGTAKTNYIAGKAGQTNITVDIYGVVSILNINVLPKAGTVFVNYTSGSDSNDGASWSSPVKTISRALAIVGDDSSIYVADGKNYLNNIDVNGLVISKDISIIGIGDNVVIDAKNRARIFNIDGLTVNLSNLIFANANVSNVNDKRGGAIWAANSILNIDNCKFIDNTAGSSSSYGGAINLKSSKANIRGSYFENNDAYYGGAINAEKNNVLLNISNSTFANNNAGATGGAICSYNKVVVDSSIFYNNTLTDKTKKGKSIKQYQDGRLTVKNSVILDGSASVNVANVSTASLENNWWGNNNSNKNQNPNPTYTNGNVNSYLIFETSINQDIVHVGDSVTIANSLNHNQKGKVVNGLPELPIVISANRGTVSPDAANIGGELSSTYKPTSSGNEVITANVLGIENVLSFFVKQATPKVVIDDVSTQWALGIYPGVANTFDVKLINSENRAISDLTIELVSNESNKVLSSYSGTVKKGTSTISMIDSTIRQITERTVWPGAQSNLIRFDVNLKYDDEIISTFSTDMILAYNGYFNRTYSYGGHDNTVNRKYTISGDIIMATQDVGVYEDQYSRFRNETWNIKTPKNAEIVKVLLYFNYNWDTSFFPNGWTLKFNNHDILNEYVSHEMDRGNLGIWGAYNYGLLVFDVTDYYKVNADNSFIINKTGNCALYPSTLYILYNSTDSTTIKDVYFSDVCDVFYPLYNQKNYDDLLKFVVNFDNVDLTNLIGANWYVFSGSSSLNNNLTFNNAKAVNPFAGYSPNDCRPYVFDVTDSIGKNNEAWFISCPQSSTTVAYEQVLIVEKKVKTTIKFDFDDLTLEIGSKFTVKPTVNPAKANVTYKSNDTSVATISQKGVITAIKSGKALITATAGDGTVYPINSTSFILTVNKKQPTISSSASFNEGNQNYVINVVLPSDATGTVSVSVDGKSGSGKVSKGKAAISISGLTSGSKEATVTYSGDDKYNSASDICTFVAIKINPTMSVSVDDISVGDVAKFSVVLPSDATGTVSVSVDGKSGSGKVSKGKATVSVSGLTSGSKEATVSYSGDDRYNSVSDVCTFVVNKVDPSMSVSVDDISVGDVAKFNVVLPSDATGTVSVSVDGKSGSAKVSKGKATVSVSGLTSGSKDASVSYSGDEKYIQKSSTEVFKVNKIIKNMTVSVDNSSVETTIIQVSDLPSDASGIVTVTVEGKSNSSKVSNGKAIIEIYNLTNGAQSIHVIYSNDDKYEVNPVTTGIDVNKLNVTLKIKADDINVGEKASIVVSLSPSGATGTITVLVDGANSGSSTISKGKATVIVSGLTNGAKSVIVLYSGDDKYNSNSASGEFTVNKVNPSMSVSVDDISVGSVAKFSVVLPSDATGTVSVSVDGKSASAKVSKGKATVSVSGLASGSKEAVVSYSGDDKYLSTSDTKTFVVNKVDPSMSVSVDDISVGDAAKFSVVLPSDASGTVTVSVDGKSGSAKVSKGKATVSVSGLDCGSKEAVVSYSGDDKYLSTSDTKTFVVNKVNPSMSVSVDDISVGSVAKFSVVLPSDATGTVSVSVDGKSASAKVSKGKATVSVSGLASGSKEATVSYSGDDKYNSNSTSVKFAVNKISPSMSVSVDDISVGDVAEFSVVLPSDATGTVTVSVDGKTGSGKLSKGKATISVSGLSSGSKKATVSYSGDNKYLSSSDSKSFVVNKVSPSMSVSVDDICVGSVAKFSVVLPSDATGTVTVSVDGKSDSAKVSKGKASISISGLTSGSKKATVSYSGDEKYNSYSASSKFVVNKISPSMSVSAANISAGDVAEFSVVLPSDATGTVTVSVDGKSGSAKVSKGKASINISGLSSGSKEATLAYSGNAKYLNVTASVSIEVEPIDPGVNVTVPSKVSAGDTPSVKVSLPADAKGNVTILLDGEEISTVPVTNGTIEVPLSALGAGNHTVEVIYSGDDKYLSESSNSTVTAEKKTTHIKVVASFTRIATDYFAGERGANYKGYLLDQDNNPVVNRMVKIAINGVTYTLKTNKKGAFYLQINLNTAKVYPMKVTFSGDSVYCAAPVAKTKLTVVKKSTSIKASNKVFKSKTKTKKITVTLKTVKNKYNGKTYLKKGKKVTLRINGKTYTAKTNAKGVAKFTIKLTKKGKYKAVIKFKGDKTYKASSKKIKIRIK